MTPDQSYRVERFNELEREADRLGRELKEARVEIARLTLQGVEAEKAALKAFSERDALRATEKIVLRQGKEIMHERDGLRAEVERLRNAIRHTHESYCAADWTDRGLHAPECLLYELEPGEEP